MMWCDFTYKGEVYPVGHPKESYWMTYHITKHPIDNFSIEGFNNILDQDQESISELRELQKNQLNCKIDTQVDGQKFCKKCVSLAKCNSALSDIFNKYIQHLCHSIKNDYVNPTTALFFDKKWKRNMLLIIDHDGIAIFLRNVERDIGRNFYLVTAFGFQDFSATEMALKFRKLYDDSDWRREQMIIYWNDKFFQNKSRFKKVDKHEIKNWNI